MTEENKQLVEEEKQPILILSNTIVDDEIKPLSPTTKLKNQQDVLTFLDINIETDNGLAKKHLDKHNHIPYDIYDSEYIRPSKHIDEKDKLLNKLKKELQNENENELNLAIKVVLSPYLDIHSRKLISNIIRFGTLTPQDKLFWYFIFSKSLNSSSYDVVEISKFILWIMHTHHQENNMPTRIKSDVEKTLIHHFCKHLKKSFYKRSEIDIYLSKCLWEYLSLSTLQPENMDTLCFFYFKYKRLLSKTVFFETLSIYIGKHKKFKHASLNDYLLNKKANPLVDLFVFVSYGYFTE